MTTRRQREGWHRPHITSSDAGLRRPRPRGESEPSEERNFVPKIADPPPDDAVMQVTPYVPVRCPGCGKSKRETYGVTGRVRYHHCADCGINFKSIEYPPSQVLR